MGETPPPQIVPEVNIRELPLDAVDGFVLSRVDGRSRASDIALACSLPLAQVEEVLTRLEQLGVLRWCGKAKSSPGPADRESANVDGPPSARPATAPGSSEAAMWKSQPPVSSAPEGASAMDPSSEGAETSSVSAALDEVELDEERRAVIDELCERLARGDDFYALLGVARDAHRKEVQRAYFRYSKQVHPDSLYGRRLGPYKDRMSRVFAGITEAYETLRKKRTRTEYDARLGASAPRPASGRPPAVGGSGPAEEAATPAGGPSSRPPRIATVSSPPGSIPAASSPPGSIPAASSPPGSIPAASSPPSAPPSGRSSARPSRRPGVNRDLMRQRLGSLRRASGSGAPGVGSRSSGPPIPSAHAPSPSRPPADRTSIFKDLAQSLHEVARVSVNAEQLEIHVFQAQQAMRSGDLQLVLHELGLALALAPDREDLREELQRVSTLVDERRTEQYERLAQEEEAAGHWSAAAGAWMRVAGSQPDSAYPARRAALALLQAGERLDQARSLAERAVRIEGDSVGHRIVLVQVLLGLSDLEGASKQLQIVTGLDPDSELVKDLQRQLVLAGHGD